MNNLRKKQQYHLEVAEMMETEHWKLLSKTLMAELEKDDQR